jgi:D-tyrosyl-tRNA(Tyr) deacylase
VRALLQRVARASVTIDGRRHAEIGRGMLILVGVSARDAEESARYLAERCAHLRMFEDADRKMNLALSDVGGEALVVSQFTLYGDTRKGNRPGFTDAAAPAQAEALYESFVAHLRGLLGDSRVATGVFRAAMQVELVNDGPVTLMVESKEPHLP